MSDSENGREMLVETLQDLYDDALRNGGDPDKALGGDDLDLWHDQSGELGEMPALVPDVKDRLAPLRRTGLQGLPPVRQRLLAERHAKQEYDLHGEDRVTRASTLGALARRHRFLFNLSAIRPAHAAPPPQAAYPPPPRRRLRHDNGRRLSAQGRLQWWLTESTWQEALENDFAWLHLMAAVPDQWPGQAGTSDPKELVTFLDLRELPQDLAVLPVRVGAVSPQQSGHDYTADELSGDLPPRGDPVYPGMTYHDGQVSLLLPLPMRAGRRLCQAPAAKYWPPTAVRPFVWPS